MLNCEQNTQKMERRILKAGRKLLRGRPCNAVFEHGHWWITTRTGAQYSVNDAEGIGTVNGFTFEQVTRGEED